VARTGDEQRESVFRKTSARSIQFARLTVLSGSPGGRTPPPSPRRFLEVLILKGFQLQFPEVLILQGLLHPVLILLDFKSFIISDLIKNEDFMEVLILGGLGRAFGIEYLK
jgi:hypothetical protein